MANLRVSLEEAHKRGWVKKDDDSPGGKSTRSRRGVNSQETNTSAGTPQSILYQALVAGDKDAVGVQWEVGGLIPARKFTVDILVGGQVVVNVDGYEFHKSLEAFQQDRNRANAFQLHGFTFLSYYTGEILNQEQLPLIVDEILAAAKLLKGTIRHLANGTAAVRYNKKISLQHSTKKSNRWKTLPCRYTGKK